MHLNPYEYARIHGNNRIHRKIEVYRFKNEYKDIYLLEVFHYEHNVYAIKFFLKKHKLSDKRYNLSYPQRFKESMGRKTGNRNFLRVLDTVLAVGLKILEKDKLASFGFLGAPKLDELDPEINTENINPDNTIANTKRHNIYLNYSKRHFNPEDFEYINSNSSSILLLRNNRNKVSLTIDKAEEYIINTIIPSL